MAVRRRKENMLGEEAMHGQMHDDHEVESVRYENADARLAYLREIYAPNKAEPEAFRTPGSFLAEFIFNGLSFDQIVSFLKSSPSKSFCACCMDERVVMKGGERLITSHKGCGAAGLVYDAVKTSASLRSRLAEIVGEQELSMALRSNDKDQVGMLWSRALAQAVGARYTHLDVDHEHHYTTMAVIDAGRCFLGDTPGEVGERSFIVSNTEVLGNKDKRSAYDLMIQYGFLALQIARGNHSTLHGKTNEYPFTIVVTRDQAFDQKLFDDVLKRFLAGKKTAGTDYDAMNYQIEFVDEAQLQQR